jgi:very-short-patch-repair endonuclease
MPPKSIITKQRVHSEMVARAVRMRRSMTPAEKKLWDHLRSGRLGGYHFRRQQIIEPYIVDFYCHKSRLVVELDGSSHHNREEYDRDRDAYLKTQGLRVLRILNTQVDKEIENVLYVILEACETPSPDE